MMQDAIEHRLRKPNRTRSGFRACNSSARDITVRSKRKRCVCGGHSSRKPRSPRQVR